MLKELLEAGNIQDLFALIVAVAGGGGLWKHLSNKSKLSHELTLKASGASEELQRSLLSRVDKMSDENKELRVKLMDVSNELSAGREKVKHLQDEIRLYELRKKAENMPLF